MHYPQARRSQSPGEQIASRFAPSVLRELEHWEVRRHLGTGSTAQVWLLEHAVSKQQVACKVPKASEDRFVLSQEAKLAQSLRHENLVQIFDEYYLDDVEPAHDAGLTCWEFLPAGSLTTRISAGGTLSVAQTVTVILPMLQVAEYLHDHHIVHGDFSPANILFDLTGRPVLIDLGAVRATAHAFHLTGTPGFVAPEVHTNITNTEELGTAADVYSIAAIAWFCLTGSDPGRPHTRVPLATLQPELAAEIVEVLEACLSAEPALRPGVHQVVQAVTHWAVPEPVDLYSSAGEEYELLLPTRKPQQAERANQINTSRKARSITRRRSRRDPEARHQWGVRRRVVLGLGSCALLLSAWGAGAYVAQTTAPNTVAHQAPEASQDFQAIVNELAQLRSQAWQQTDATLVKHFAVEDSEVYHDDITALSRMQEIGAALDGLRMHADIHTVRHVHHQTVVEVDWHTDAYVQRDSTGRPVETTPARSEALTLVLQQTTSGWRLSSVALRE